MSLRPEEMFYYGDINYNIYHIKSSNNVVNSPSHNHKQIVFSFYYLLVILDK